MPRDGSELMKNCSIDITHSAYFLLSKYPGEDIYNAASHTQELLSWFTVTALPKYAGNP